jgi:hypothetical protein
VGGLRVRNMAAVDEPVAVPIEEFQGRCVQHPEQPLACWMGIDGDESFAGQGI